MMNNFKNDTVLRKFAANIKTVRQSKKMTQSEVAIESGISRITYLNIENRKTSPTWRTIKKIADALGTDCYKLLGQDPEKM